MAAKLSRSWSFFRGKHTENKHYLHEDYQPPPQGSRINLQQRFNQQDQRMRNRPLPPPPTQNGFVPHENSLPVNHESRHAYENLPAQKDTNGAEQGPSNIRRRPFSNLPSGVLPLSSDIVNQVKPRANKVIQEGGRKVNRALQEVRTSFSSFTQMFRNSTRRRYKLDGKTPNQTPRHTPRHTPRKTPGKLYSPFNMTTPVTPHSYFKAPKRLQGATPRRNMPGNENVPRALTPQMNRQAEMQNYQWSQFHSPSQRFDRDVSAMRNGLQDLDSVTSRILRNGKLH